MGVTIPIDTLGAISGAGLKDPKWDNAMNRIYDLLYHENCEKKELTKDEEELLDATLEALKELEKWKKRHFMRK